MIVLRARLLPRKIVQNACRTFSSETEKPKLPYWHAKFPDLKPRSFDEMPTIEEKLDPFKLHEIFPRLFKKYGYIMRHPIGDGKYTVHTCHYEDVKTVYTSDISYVQSTGKPAERMSHYVLKDYRENNKELYDNVGLGPGNGEFVPRIRRWISDSMSTRIDEKLEKVSDDLIEIIRANVGEGGEIELLPLLFRWAFENVGLKFLDKRLGALYQNGNEEADKMVEAVAVTNEMIALTTIDPETDYNERYKKLEVAQNFMHGVLTKYIKDVASRPDSKCAVKKILDDNPKDAITVTLDGFQGAVMTVPLTVLMALYNLAINKDVQAKARKDVMKYLPTKDTKYCSKNTSPLLTVKHIIFETLRFNPPIIGNGRIIKSDLVLGGYNVPKETNVILHMQVAYRLEEFQKDPLKFAPDRFLSGGPTSAWNRHVFGNFTRFCIGFRFANDTMFLILLKMLRNFEISYDGDEVTMINRLHNEPEKPLFLKLKPLPK